MCQGCLRFSLQDLAYLSTCAFDPGEIRRGISTLWACTTQVDYQDKKMPRVEDIAWKFVIRQGKKWRCPHCQNEYFGSVTRVKSHFLKQPKGGIAPCTKVPEHISTLMELLHNQVHNKDDIAWKFVNRLGENKWRCHHCRKEFFGDLTGVKGHLLKVPIEGTSVCTEVPGHVRNLMRSLLDEVAEEESRGANGQSSIEPQSRHMPAQAEVAEEESREANGQSFTEPQSRDMPIEAEVAEEESREANSPLSMGALFSPGLEFYMEQLNFNQQGVIGSNSDQQSQAERQFHPISTVPLLVQSGHALVPPQHRSVLHQSVDHEIRDTQQNAIMPLDNRDTTRQPDLHDSPPENLVESRDAIVNTPEEIQTNEEHNPTMGSSLRNDLSVDVDHTNRLQDWSQQCVVEGVPFLNNTSPTNAVEHPYQLYPRCDKEDGNDTRLFRSPTPMDIDHSIELPHSSDSPNFESTIDDLQVPEVATNATGPSSSQEMNRGSPNLNVQSIYANDEEIRNLKRKVEELEDKEAVIKEQMEMESAASSVRKKPRILVERWLRDMERARNNFQTIGQVNAETLPPKEQVETLTREVEELINQTPQTLPIKVRDAKGVKFLERKLTGKAIYRNTKWILDRLKENHACILGIYGMGGVGKTTIMMHIHNSLLNDATFDVVFITVSQDFSIYKLQSDIWKALKLGIMEDEHEKKRAAMLAEQLERKKNCVLILDDVWERIDLEEVGIPFGADGIKLVLTTRSFDVCNQMQCQENIKIKPLSQKEGESLFLEELGSKVTLNLEIKTIVESIVKECAGLPIGVITMARSMRGVTDVFEWRDSLVKLKESSMGQTDMEKKVLMNLKVSYDRLGNHNIQQCLLSCALYPEDTLIEVDELIEFFIDQGLIGGLNTRMKQYDRGLTILKKLRNVGLLEDFRKIWVKMHDLIRDMALYIMGATSIVKAGKKLRNIPSEEYWTDALEKVSLMENKISEIPLNISPNCPKLSTLLLNGNLLQDVVIPDSFFEQLCGLKILNLSGCDLRELPNSISDLVNLRALLLRKCRKLRRIPYLGKLTSLRKLDTIGCDSLEMLEGLEKLVNLRYFALPKTPMERVPKVTLDCLPKLQFLDVSAIIEENITKLWAVETFLCYLKNVDDFNECVRFIEQKHNPCYYELRVDFEESKFKVEVSDGARFLKNVPGRHVFISGWSHAIVSVRGECTGIFILIPLEVQKILMRKCNGITNLSDMGPLEYLDRLWIDGCENLGVLCGRHDEELIDILHSPAPTPSPLIFVSLRTLMISHCTKLKYLFGHGSKPNLPHLREIVIWRCGEMVGIIAAVTSPPPSPLPTFRRLEDINVSNCDKMKRAVEFEWMPHFPNLRRLKVSSCGNMEEIIGGPPPYVPVEEISLEFLTVAHCDKMRKLLSHECLPHLRNLQTINVEFCKGMVEMTSGAGEGQEGSIMTHVNNPPSSFQPPISLPKLKRLFLYNLPQLKSICGVPISCDSMEELGVHRCPELKRIPLQLQLRETKELPHIWVEDEEKWETLIWDDSNAQTTLESFLRKGEQSNDRFSSPREGEDADMITFYRRMLYSPNAIELDAEGKDPL